MPRRGRRAAFYDQITPRAMRLLRIATYHSVGQLVLIYVRGEFAGIGMATKCTEPVATFTAAFCRSAGMPVETTREYTEAQLASFDRQRQRRAARAA